MALAKARLEGDRQAQREGYRARHPSRWERAVPALLLAATFWSL